MTAQIAIEATDLAALHTHAANRGEVLQVRFLQLCREVAGTTPQPTAPRVLPPAPPAQPELALSYEPTPAPAGSLGILARAARLNQPQA